MTKRKGSNHKQPSKKTGAGPKKAGLGRAAGGSEWVGGLVTIPTLVETDEGPVQPEALFWMREDGLIVGSTAEAPGLLLPAAAEHLRETIARPMVGPPGPPSRVGDESPSTAPR